MDDEILLADQIRKLGADVEHAQLGLRQLTRWLHHNVVASDVLSRQLPDDVAPILDKMCQAMDAVRSGLGNLFDRLCSEPAHHLLVGRRLTREEFFLLAAAGDLLYSNKAVGLSAHDDYEVHEMFHYEDQERVCHINPDLKPRSSNGRLLLRFGVCPEEIPLAGLRGEQRKFFEEKLPEIAARFKPSA